MHQAQMKTQASQSAIPAGRGAGFARARDITNICRISIKLRRVFQ
jgi:hypothetical protein